MRFYIFETGSFLRLEENYFVRFIANANSWNLKKSEKSFLDKIQIGKLHWLHDFAVTIWTFWIGHVRIMGPLESLLRGKPKVDDSLVHDDHETSPKFSKFLKQKAATNGTFRICFLSGKIPLDFWTVICD